VRVHDVMHKRLGTAIPYGVYERTHNWSGLSVNLDHATVECAVATVQQWWQQMGQEISPKAQHVLSPADGGGSHGSHARLWQVAWHALYDTTGLDPTSWQTGKQVSDAELAHVNVSPAAFHDTEWNDVIKPSRNNQYFMNL
jgi:hypothetical protein